MIVILSVPRFVIGLIYVVCLVCFTIIVFTIVFYESVFSILLRMFYPPPLPFGRICFVVLVVRKGGESS